MKARHTYLHIETCNLCNRKCPWCLFGQTPDFRGSKLQFIDNVYIEKLLNELNQNHFTGVLSLYAINEPLMDKRIRDGSLLRLCRSELRRTDVKIIISTNGDLLNDSIAETMFYSGLDKMYVSCYEENTLNKAKDLKDKYEKMVILDNTNEKANNLKFNRAGSICSYSGYVAENKKSCTLPIFSSVVGFDGEVRLCSNDAIGQIKIGNIKNENLYDILNSKKMRALRNQILINKKNVFPCNACNFEDLKEGEGFT